MWLRPMAYSSEPALWITENGVQVLRHLARTFLWAAPLSLIAIKIYDRHLEYPAAPWQDALLSGFFGKIDDLSFWVVVAGLLSIINLMTATRCLGPYTGLDSLPLKRGEIRFAIRATLFTVSLYILAMYLTGGTFFSELLPQQRSAQILEGVLNLILIVAFQGFTIVAHATVRRCEGQIAAQPQGPLPQNLRDCAASILNAPTTIVIALCAGIFFFPLFKFFGGKAYDSFGYRWLNWTMFKPEPWKEVGNGLLAAAGVIVLMFWPFIPLSFQTWKRVRGRSKITFNWFIILLLVVLQTGIIAAIVVVIRELSSSTRDLYRLVRVD